MELFFINPAFRLSCSLEQDNKKNEDNVTFVLNVRLFSFTMTTVLVVYEFILSSGYHIFTCAVPVFMSVC